MIGKRWMPILNALQSERRGAQNSEFLDEHIKEVSGEVTEEEHYRETIIDMVRKMKNLRYLHMAFGFVRRLYVEETKDKSERR